MMPETGLGLAGIRIGRRLPTRNPSRDTHGVGAARELEAWWQT
jgi:hypothetical protein